MIYLGLGSNLGPRERTLAQGLERIARRGFRPRKRSSIYLTEPLGGPRQGWYLNLVVAGETRLTPDELLAACLETERELGRERGERWGARTLDIDLLLYDDELRRSPELVLPHARLAERLFVLAPLEEIAPDLRHPRLGLTVRELRSRCPDSGRVIRCTNAAGAAP